MLQLAENIKMVYTCILYIQNISIETGKILKQTQIELLQKKTYNIFLRWNLQWTRLAALQERNKWMGRQSWSSIPSLTQWAKGSSVAVLQCRLQLWFRFNPWSGNFHAKGAAIKKKKKRITRHSNRSYIKWNTEKQELIENKEHQGVVG